MWMTPVQSSALAPLTTDQRPSERMVDFPAVFWEVEINHNNRCSSISGESRWLRLPAFDQLLRWPWIKKRIPCAMEVFALFLLLGFQAKHLVADFFLQSRWMIIGKGSFSHPGGYAHVGVHALGSLGVLALSGTPVIVLAGLLLGEAIAHYLIDFAKVRWSKARPADVNSRAFWAAQGTDQFMHQITYALMIFVVLRSSFAVD
jgi:hypothetical protein